MTKQEVIKKAYEAAGVEWEKVKDLLDEHAWIYFENVPSGVNLYSKDWHYSDYSLYRPASLNGLSNNNGWTSINSESDLPKDPEPKYTICRFYDGEFFNYGIDYDNDDVERFFKTRGATHYKISEKEQPPIY